MGHVPKFVLSASASPDGWPEKGRHIGGQKAESKLVKQIYWNYHRWTEYIIVLATCALLVSRSCISKVTFKMLDKPI